MFSRGKVILEDVEKRYEEGELSDYRIDNTTLVIWNWYGWKIIESASCVDINNYNHEIGKDICITKIKDRIWKMLGYELQLYNLKIEMDNSVENDVENENEEKEERICAIINRIGKAARNYINYEPYSEAELINAGVDLAKELNYIE